MPNQKDHLQSPSVKVAVGSSESMQRLTREASRHFSDACRRPVDRPQIHQRLPDRVSKISTRSAASLGDSRRRMVRLRIVPSPRARPRDHRPGDLPRGRMGDDHRSFRGADAGWITWYRVSDASQRCTATFASATRARRAARRGPAGARPTHSEDIGSGRGCGGGCGYKFSESLSRLTLGMPVCPGAGWFDPVRSRRLGVARVRVVCSRPSRWTARAQCFVRWPGSSPGCGDGVPRRGPSARSSAACKMPPTVTCTSVSSPGATD